MMIVKVSFWRALSYMAIDSTFINASSFKRNEWWKLEFLLHVLSCLFVVAFNSFDSILVVASMWTSSTPNWCFL